jgi:hypothetical protein
MQKLILFLFKNKKKSINTRTTSINVFYPKMAVALVQHFRQSQRPRVLNI